MNTMTAGTPPSSPLGLNTALMAKVLMVAAAMEPLVKRDTNPNEGWSFVSIDDYYEKAASKLLAVGVSWLISEEGVEQISPHSDAVGWKFAFTLYDNAGGMIKNIASFTVPHDIEGPQTAGKVVSYAEKVFLRQLLKLVTGEPDADVSKSKRQQPAKQARVVAERKSETSTRAAPDASLSYDEIEKLINASTTQTELDLIVEENKLAISRMRKNDPDVYEKLAVARTLKMEGFQQDGV